MRRAGLNKYYELQALDSSYSPTPVSQVGGNYSYLDDQKFQETHLAVAGDAKKFNAHCEGIHCTACIWVLEKLPQIESGIVEVRVDFPRKLVDVAFDPAKISLSKVAAIMDRFGYAPDILDPNQIQVGEKGISRDLLLRMGVAAVAAGNIMMLSVSLYEGGFSLSEKGIENVFGWGSFILAVPSVLFSAQPFYKGAFAAIRSGMLHLDLPLAVGIVIGFILSTVNLILGTGVIYYDSISVLIFLLLCGRVLQERSLSKIKFSSGIAQSLIPASAQKVLPDGSLTQAYVGSLKCGDVVLVADREVIPVDGTLESSVGHINLSVLTGEAVPVSVKIGDPVWAGTKVVGESIRIKVEKISSATRIGTLLRQVEDKISREPLKGLTMEKLTRRFVSILALASILTIFMFWGEGVDSILNRLLALFVVTCPCALGLAAPLTFTSAIYRASSKGMIIKGGEIIERITRIKKIFLDKTGTLTDGEMKVAALIVPNNNGVWEILNDKNNYIGLEISSLLSIAAALEDGSRHPVGRAIRLFASTVQNLQSINLTSRNTLQKGVSGVDSQGDEWCLRALEKADYGDSLQLNRLESGLTQVGMFKNNLLVLIFAVGDSLRSEASNVVKFFQSKGVELALLTGDNEIAAKYFGVKAGIAEQNIFAGESPEGKAAIIRKSNLDIPSAMVGDGVNDTAALSEATVGIGVQGGAEACLKVADVFFSQPGIRNLSELWLGAHRTMGVFRRCVLFSLAYNLLAGIGAISGLIGPLEAAVLMPFSSITVILLSTKGRSF
jgi:Cu2+-exporting ATPase